MATIRVSFAELRTTGHYSNMRAEASIEMESQDPEHDFPELWARVRKEVREQLDAEEDHRREELAEAARDFAEAARGFFGQRDEGPGSDDDSIDENELDDPDNENQDGDNDEREDLDGCSVPDEVFSPPDYEGPEDDGSGEDEPL